ncbi:hypothetical protein LJC16_00785 [Bacteroidales bacterium OttesenSCG-928-C19]|nr:hypothetical protein [Bacteroidales bacterium OttesenSCG-928-C19]
MASGLAKLSLIIDIQNKLKMGLDSAKQQVSKATGEMSKRIQNFKIKNIEAFKAIKNEVPGLGRAIELLKNPYVLATAAVVGLGMALMKLNNTAKEWESLSIQQQASETRLAQVMKNTMNATEAEIKSIKALASEQQKLGVIGDEVQLSGAQELATYLTKADSLKKLMPVMNDMLAQQYEFGATQEQAINIASMMGKVMDGQVGALSRYGYKFDENQEKILKNGNEMQRVATLADVVSSAVGGVNAALAATPEGVYKQIQNKIGDLKEDAGKLYTELKLGWNPVREATLNFWTTIVMFVSKHKDQIIQAITTIANFFANAINMALNALKWLRDAFLFIYEWRAVLIGIGAAFVLLNAKMIATSAILGVLAAKTAIVTAAQWLLNVAMSANPIGIIIVAIGALIGLMVTAYNKFDKFRAIVDGTWASIKNFGNILKEYVIDRVKDLLGGLGKMAEALSALFSGDFKGAFNLAKDGVKDITGISASQRASQRMNEIPKSFKNAYNNSLEESAQRKAQEDNPDGDFAGVPDMDFNTDGTDKPLSSDASAITEGGKSKVVNITIGSFIENFSSKNETINNMSKEELEKWLMSTFQRVITSAELTQ